MTDANNIAKLQAEKDSLIRCEKIAMLRIRLVPGMETLAANLFTGRRLFSHHFFPKPAPADEEVPANAQQPLYEHEQEFVEFPSPNGHDLGSQFSPLGEAVQLIRHGIWLDDTTGVYPTLVVPEDRVIFFDSPKELLQAKSNFNEKEQSKVCINSAHVVMVERFIASVNSEQSLEFDDISDYRNAVLPAVVPPLLSVSFPAPIPQAGLGDLIDLQLSIEGGTPPYTFSMHGQPRGLEITQDGRLYGYIEQKQLPQVPVSPNDPNLRRNDFVIRILVQDNSIPNQLAMAFYRYRID